MGNEQDSLSHSILFEELSYNMRKILFVTLSKTATHIKLTVKYRLGFLYATTTTIEMTDLCRLSLIVTLIYSNEIS